MAGITTEMGRITISIPANKTEIDKYCKKDVNKIAIDRFINRDYLCFAP